MKLTRLFTNVTMIAFALVCTSICVSCGKDDDDATVPTNTTTVTDVHPRALIGTWENKHVIEPAYNQYDINRVVFSSNGKCTYSLITYKNGQSQVLTTSSGTWTADAQYITEIFSDGKNVTKYSVSGNTLSLYIYGSNSSPRVYTKK